MYTKSRHEKTAYDQLAQKNIEAYLPLIRTKRRWSDRTKWVDIPLFRSYLFVKIELKNHLYVLQTIGVHHVIKFNQEVAIISDEQIQSIKLMIEGGYDPQSVDYFVVGDEAEIAAGPMKGIRGIVSRIAGEDKFVLKIDAIQHAISVHIERGFLKAIK
ncbi:MAG: UpxY family transcription antiterminator [Candidatus Marinimicrobia bacterium]|nr:UpxY family transcription antiterminator [Candidatus Neomarinimicrobiota bacterium]